VKGEEVGIRENRASAADDPQPEKTHPKARSIDKKHASKKEREASEMNPSQASQEGRTQGRKRLAKRRTGGDLHLQISRPMGG